MSLAETNYYVEDKRQIDVLEEFAPRVCEILERYRDERQHSVIARRIGENAARLTEMITKNGDGKPNWEITPYYLAKFIEAGIMSVEEILDGKKLSDVSDRACLFFERMILSRKTIHLVTEAQHR